MFDLDQGGQAVVDSDHLTCDGPRNQRAGGCRRSSSTRRRTGGTATASGSETRCPPFAAGASTVRVGLWEAEINQDPTQIGHDLLSE